MIRNHPNTLNNGILIVEDERIVALDMAQSLKQLGYNVIGLATTGEEAIKIAVDRNPDLIIMDIRLKGVLDGIETAERINSEADIPFIYITAFADDETLERAKATEPVGYLLKPYDKRVLHTTIEMALYKHHMEKRVRDSERWLSTTLNSMGDATITTDSSGTVILMNPAAENLTGWQQQEAVGKNISTVIYLVEAEKDQRLESPVELVKKKCSLIHLNSDIYLVNRDGKHIPILGTASPIINGKNNISGVVVVLINITDRKKAEKDREVLFKKVSAAQERLKVLSSRLMEIQEMERRNLARELHDELGQILTAIKINMQIAHHFIGSPEIGPHINEAIELTEEAIKQVRSLSLDLRPSMLDDLGLVPALRSYIDRQSQRTGIAARLIAEPLEKRLSPNLEISCYRITQEAFTNVIRHAGKDVTVKVELWKENNELNLKISDTGKGFDVYAALQKSLSGKSMGILGMQERVELVGGKLKINSKADKGTDIHAIFTLDK